MPKARAMAAYPREEWSPLPRGSVHTLQGIFLLACVQYPTFFGVQLSMQFIIFFFIGLHQSHQFLLFLFTQTTPNIALRFQESFRFES